MSTTSLTTTLNEYDIGARPEYLCVISITVLTSLFAIYKGICLSTHHPLVLSTPYSYAKSMIFWQSGAAFMMTAEYSLAYALFRYKGTSLPSLRHLCFDVFPYRTLCKVHSCVPARMYRMYGPHILGNARVNIQTATGYSVIPCPPQLSQPSISFILQ